MGCVTKIVVVGSHKEPSNTWEYEGETFYGDTVEVEDTETYYGVYCDYCGSWKIWIIPGEKTSEGSGDEIRTVLIIGMIILTCTLIGAIIMFVLLMMYEFLLRKDPEYSEPKMHCQKCGAVWYGVCRNAYPINYTFNKLPKNANLYDSLGRAQLY